MVFSLAKRGSNAVRSSRRDHGMDEDKSLPGRVDLFTGMIYVIRNSKYEITYDRAGWQIFFEEEHP